MEYQVSRDGTMFGPYTEEELRKYSLSGNIVGTDLVRSSVTEKWTPLRKILKKLDDEQRQREAKDKSLKALRMEGLRPNIPAPPDIPWWFAAILGVFTVFTFFVAWDGVEGFWLYRGDRERKALWYYLLSGAMFAINGSALYSMVSHDIFRSAATTSSSSGLLGAAGFVVWIFARMSMRKSLLQHYNHVEPINLRL